MSRERAVTRTARGAIIGLSSLVAVLIATAAGAQGPSGFVMHEQPRPLPEVAFRDQADRPLRFADFRGKVVLLNLWATWCAPCRQEMPTLDRLQTILGGPDFEVVALSVDREGRPAVEAFYEELGLEALAIYVDDSAKASRVLGAFGLPTTLLVNRDGEEIGRLLGPAEWDSPAMVRFLGDLLETSKPPSPTISASKVD
jgi:thiol-disulfide isomerase/thioredoxin